MRTISLRKFRTEIGDLHEQVEVSRRDGNGDILMLGFWTPYEKNERKPVAALEIPVEDDEPKPRVIRTPEEAAAVAPGRTPYSKEAQAGRRTRR